MNLPPLRTLFFEDLSVGMTETLEKTVSSSDVVGFAQLTGDRNPIHLSEHFAARTSFGKRIAHGLYTASLISAVLGTRLLGAVKLQQAIGKAENGAGRPPAIAADIFRQRVISPMRERIAVDDQ